MGGQRATGWGGKGSTGSFEAKGGIGSDGTESAGGSGDSKSGKEATWLSETVEGGGGDGTCKEADFWPLG